MKKVPYVLMSLALSLSCKSRTQDVSGVSPVDIGLFISRCERDPELKATILQAAQKNNCHDAYEALSAAANGHGQLGKDFAEAVKAAANSM